MIHNTDVHWNFIYLVWCYYKPKADDFFQVCHQQIGRIPLKTSWVQFDFVKNRTESHRDSSWVSSCGCPLITSGSRGGGPGGPVIPWITVQHCRAQSPHVRASSRLLQIPQCHHNHASTFSPSNHCDFSIERNQACTLDSKSRKFCNLSIWILDPVTIVTLDRQNVSKVFYENLVGLTDIWKN